MKNIIITIILTLSVTVFGGCEWLEVNPKTEKKRDDLLSSQQGFQDALIGAYIQMKEESAYGANLTYYMIDAMGSIYDDGSTTSTLYRLRQHNWGNASVESLVNRTFAKLYDIISSTNSILEVIDERKSVFRSEADFNLIKAEALAIRAMCHFDVLRIFGPIPAQANDKRILPYVTTFGRKLTEHSTWDEYCALLLQDLSDAEELLENDDPILHYSVADLGSPNGTSSSFKPDGTFFAYRYFRFNYYAVRALQARVNLWIGTEGALSEALAAAKTVIEAKNPDGTDKFRLGTATDFSEEDLFFSSEHIMALSDFSLIDKYSTYFTGGRLYKGTTYTAFIKNNLYGTTGVDIREPEIGKWWTIVVNSAGTKYCICNKYVSDETKGMRIPLLRLSEMYLIAAEIAPLAEAQGYYTTFLKSRNLASATLTEAGRIATLRKEYLKEFYAEGYIFYVYKRLASIRTDILWPLAASAFSPNYVVPKPSDELVYTDEEIEGDE